MGGTISLHHCLHVGHDWAKHYAAVMAFVAGAMAATVVFAVVLSPVWPVRSSLAHPAGIESNLAYPAPELPREWRWKPDAISFDHMYRESGAASGAFDWISDPERRAR